MNDENERKSVASLGDYVSSAAEAVHVFKWLWKEVATPESKKYLKRMFWCLGIVILLITFQPKALGWLVRGLSTHNGEEIVKGLACFLLSLTTLKFVDKIQQKSREWVIGLHWKRLDHRITELFSEKSVAQHVQDSSRLSVSSINKGKTRIIDMQNVILFDAIGTIAQLLFSVGFLLFLDLVAFGIMSTLIAIYIVWSLHLNLKVTQECTPIEKEWKRLNRRRDERFEKIERVKVCGHEGLERDEMSAIFEGIIQKDRNFWTWFIDKASIRSYVNLICFALTVSWGAWLVWTNQRDIAFFLPLLMWATRISENVWKLGDIEHKINWNMPSVKLMIEALQIAPAIVDKPNAIDIDHQKTHKIEFVDVSHTYPARKKRTDEIPAALSRVSFTIEPGEIVGCMGPSGAGKSTLMKKLLRFDDPTSGKILVDGVDLRDISQASWKRGIGCIPQQAQVLDGTIRSNLVYGLSEEGRKAMSDDDLWQLMKLLKIDFGERLSDGLDTLVGKNGLKLSGGEAQRLMIGSAVIKKPWLLVIDEATASLDSDTEHYVQEGLAKALSQNTSALIVAHRLSTIRTICNKFIVLRPAFEVPEGESQVEAVAYSFEELYEISSTFRRLADRQGITIGRKPVCV